MIHVDIELTPEEFHMLCSSTDHYQLVLKHAKSNVMAGNLHTAMAKIRGCKPKPLPRRKKRRVQ